MSALHWQLSLKTRALDVVIGVKTMYETILHNYYLKRLLYRSLSKLKSRHKRNKRFDN